MIHCHALGTLPPGKSPSTYGYYAVVPKIVCTLLTVIKHVKSHNKIMCNGKASWDYGFLMQDCTVCAQNMLCNVSYAN